ncbi:MAG: nucleoside hydrolase [Oscillospiraceae bacterium]|nr:nucleoside hydrolase [Oscillospiraceae bacterium]
MRRFIIDTDTGSDDAVAIVMALRDPNVRVEAFTTVGGNVGVDRATENCLISIEMAGTYAPPVYKGLGRPLVKEVREEEKNYSVHGRDGMGDIGLAPPKLKAEDEHAVDFLIRYIEENPDELELVTIGPVTNLAWVAHRSPETLKKLKRIYMMMGTGAWFGNASGLSEGNASMDPEALDIVLRYAGCDIVLIGWDMCINEYVFTKEDIEMLYATGSPIAKFCLDINQMLIKLNVSRFGEECFDMADPAAMAVALDPGMIEKSVTAYHHVETSKGLAYGAICVEVYSERGKRAPNATTVVKADAARLKKCIVDRIV